MIFNSDHNTKDAEEAELVKNFRLGTAGIYGSIWSDYPFSYTEYNDYLKGI